MQKWEHKSVYVYYKTTKKDMFGSPKEGYWVMTIDGKDFAFKDGLDAMGNGGWELAAVQQEYESYGGTSGGWHYLPHFYIFKRPAG
jgi:hypothetical protein